LAQLERWLADAEQAGAPEPQACALATVGHGGHPSARTVSLKRIESAALILTSALWTRKVREIAANPWVSLLFHWPAQGRQVHIAARAELAERELARELFDERDLAHRVQTLVSRQGERIESLEELRERHAHLMATTEAPPRCPEDWGALRLHPEALEFWSQEPDRIHERVLYERVEDGWRRCLLAP
jgi:pyridoxamine 5'-phosphate oxidase